MSNEFDNQQSFTPETPAQPDANQGTNTSGFYHSAGNLSREPIPTAQPAQPATPVQVSQVPPVQPAASAAPAGSQPAGAYGQAAGQAPFGNGTPYAAGTDTGAAQGGY